MDFQRIFIFLGLAVTGYFLILTWQQDYGATTATEGTPSIAQEEMVLGGSIPSAPAKVIRAFQNSVPYRLCR